MEKNKSAVRHFVQKAFKGVTRVCTIKTNYQACKQCRNADRLVASKTFFVCWLAVHFILQKSCQDGKVEMGEVQIIVKKFVKKD